MKVYFPGFVLGSKNSARNKADIVCVLFDVTFWWTEIVNLLKATK